MAVLTDLTWTQLNAALGGAAIIVDGTTGKVMIDAGVVAGETLDALTDSGVVKFMSKLLDGCKTAQDSANSAQAVGERLAAFGSTTSGTPAAGYVSLVRNVSVRAELASATEIIGNVN